MIAASAQKGRRIALFGLGGSGLVMARSLREGGAEIFCFDDNPDHVQQAADEGLPVADLRQLDFATIDALALSPGIPLTHPKPHWCVELAKAENVPIIGDVELFALERAVKAPGCPFIAITGTNGKSTTTALIAHIFRSAGRDVQLGGNIGTAILSLDEPDDEKVYVVEVSSYQIELAPNLGASVGILLNITPDHLDRHGDMKNYAAIKASVPAKSDLAVVGVDDIYCSAIAAELSAIGKPLIAVSVKRVENGIYLDGTKLVEAKNGQKTVLFDLDEAPALRGAHNGQNAGAAWAACLNSGLSPTEIAEGFRTYCGLAHRMEQIGSRASVLFVNDSKGTNSDAVGVALSSFERIYWIAGGLAKEGGIESLRQYFPRIAKAYLIGEAAAEFAVTLGNQVPFEISNTLAVATQHAARDAANDNRGEAVVLLSPACASFDQFANFEKRGEAFRNHVLALDGINPFKEAL